MEYISSFTYCDSIQTEFTLQGPKPQIVNPLQVLAPIAIPSNYSFSVACNLAGFDATKENSIQICFVAPSGEIINDTQEIKFKIPDEQIRENKPAMMQFNLDMRNVAIREIGLFSTKVYVNGKEIGDYKIEVIIGE